MRDLARTLETACWFTGATLGVAIAVLAPYVAMYWVKPDAISHAQVVDAVRIMGCLVALQWPLSVYQGGLLGLQRQVRLNALRVLFGSASGFGAVLILLAVSPDIVTFFRWQVCVATGAVAATAIAFWSALPAATRRPRAKRSLLFQSGSFTAGMATMSVFAMLLVQMDKIVLSKLVPLEAFGHYVLAGTVASGLQLFVVPLYTALFPRLSSLVAAQDENSIRALYHDSGQLIAVLAVPLAAMLAVFPYEVLAIWTGDPQTATRSAPILAVLAVGTALNGLMHVPYALQLAHGWTRIGVVITLVQVVVFLPLVVLAVGAFGAVGAAWVWAVLNAFYVAVGLPWTHLRLLQGEATAWALRNVGVPASGAIVVTATGRFLMPENLGRWTGAGYIVTVAILATCAALALAPRVRCGLLGARRANSAIA